MPREHKTTDSHLQRYAQARSAALKVEIDTLERHTKSLLASIYINDKQTDEFKTELEELERYLNV